MATKPIILTVDDEPLVVRAVQRDLLRHYGDRYRVLRAESGQEALSILRELRRREEEEARTEPVAVIIADQMMPGMTGVEFLEQSRELVPDAMRVLLTAYADTEAAIRAINQAAIRQYLRKPWEPPEEFLYPQIDALVRDWLDAYEPPAEGLKLIGHRWSAASHALRAFLERNLVPYSYLDIERDESAKKIAAAMERAGQPGDLPIVEFEDGERVSSPQATDVARKIGLLTQPQAKSYDLVVVGAGPAGLAAAVYGASEGLNTLLVEREAPGGQAGTSQKIENYLGFAEGITGRDLTKAAVKQAAKFGAELLSAHEVDRLRIEGPYRVLTLDDGEEISSRVLLIATGVSYRKLDAPGVAELTGKGVYYGATTLDVKSCSIEDEVLVIGGGNSAGQAAVAFAARGVRQVTMVVRSDGLSDLMSRYLVDRIEKTSNIRVWPRTEVAAVEGADRLERVTLHCTDGSTSTLPASGLYIFIGAEPRTDWLGGLVERDDRGFLLTGPDLPRDGGHPKDWPLEREPYLLETSVPGIFAAGDVRHESIKRVASAVGEGSIAVQFTHRYLAQP